MHRGPRTATACVLVLLFVTFFVDGAARVQPDSLLLADFDADTIQIKPGLPLWLFTDEQFGGSSEVVASLQRPGTGGSRGALRLSFRLVQDFANPFAGAWAYVGPEGLATDLSAWRGLRFHARSAHATAFSAGVIRFGGMVRRYGTPFETKPEWTLVELPFDRFQELGPGGAPAAKPEPLSTKDITAVGFSVVPKLVGEFVMDIDRLEFYR